MKKLKKVLTLMFVASTVLATVFVGGCSNAGGSSTASASQETKSIAEQIKQVENDPNMPPQAKQSVLATLRAKAEQKGSSATTP